MILLLKAVQCSNALTKTHRTIYPCSWRKPYRVRGSSAPVPRLHSIPIEKLIVVCKMTEQGDLAASLQLAIQAQEEIKQQLLDEIKALESEQKPTRASVKTLKFYTASIKRAQDERNTVQAQINKFNSSILPGLEQQLDRVRQKRAAVDGRTQTLRAARTQGIELEEFQRSLEAELAELTKRESELQEQTAAAKSELRSLQEAQLSVQRENARKGWETEMADELGLNKRTMGRRRSNTVSVAPKAPRVHRRTSVKSKHPPLPL